MNYLTDERMSDWNWMVQGNDPVIVKLEIGSHCNKVESRIATVNAFVKVN